MSESHMYWFGHLLRLRGTGQRKCPVERGLIDRKANMHSGREDLGMEEAQGGFCYTQLDFSSESFILDRGR